MNKTPFGIQTPTTDKERREFLISEGKCPECGGELDTGWECNDCGRDFQADAS